VQSVVSFSELGLIHVVVIPVAIVAVMIVNVVIPMVIVAVSGFANDDRNGFRLRGNQCQQSGSEQENEEEFLHKMTFRGG
jgi:hypothetical protein